MIPFGIGLPTLLSLNFQEDYSVANVLSTYFIPALSLLCLVNVSVGAVTINSTFLDLVKEKLAKKSVEFLKKFTRKKKIIVADETLRFIFDITYKDKDEDLSDRFLDLEHQLFDIALINKGSAVFETSVLKKGIKNGTFHFCDRCQANGLYRRSLRRMKVCKACSMENLLDEREKDRIRKEEEASASEERKLELAREMELKRKEENEKKMREKELKTLIESALKTKDHSRAIQLLSEGISVNPHNVDFYYQRSLIYLKEQKDEDGLKDASLCLEIDPNQVQSYVIKGCALIANKKYKEAKKVFQQGIKKFPSSYELEVANQMGLKVIKSESPATFCEFVQTLFVSTNKRNIVETIDKHMQESKDRIARLAKFNKENKIRLKKKRQLQEVRDMGRKIHVIELVDVAGLPQKDQRGFAYEPYCEVLVPSGKNFQTFVSTIAKAENNKIDENEKQTGETKFTSQTLLFEKGNCTFIKRWMMQKEGVIIAVYNKRTNQMLGTVKFMRYEVTAKSRAGAYEYYPLLDNDGHKAIGRLGVAFYTGTDHYVCRQLVKKNNKEFVFKHFFAWKKSATGESNLIIRVVKETFVYYALKYPYKKKKEKTKVGSYKHLTFKEKLEQARLEKIEWDRKEKEWENTLFALLTKKNPQKATKEHIREMLEKNKGREIKFIQKLHRKYKMKLPFQYSDEGDDLKSQFQLPMDMEQEIPRIIMTEEAFKKLAHDAHLEEYANPQNIFQETLQKMLNIRKKTHEDKDTGVTILSRGLHFRGFRAALFKLGKDNHLKGSKAAIRSAIIKQFLIKYLPFYESTRLIRKTIKAQKKRNVLPSKSVRAVAEIRYHEHTAIIALQRAYKRRIRWNKSIRIIKRWINFLSEKIRKTKQRNSLAHQMTKAMVEDEGDEEYDKDNHNIEEGMDDTKKKTTFFGKLFGMFTLSGGKKSKVSNLELDDSDEDETDSDDDSDNESGEVNTEIETQNESKITKIENSKKRSKIVDLSLESDESIRDRIKTERQVGRTWQYISNRIIKILVKIREAYRKEGDQGEVKINWKQADNISAVVNGYFTRGMVYLNVVLSLMMNPKNEDNQQGFIETNINVTTNNVTTAVPSGSTETGASAMAVFDYRAEIMKMGAIGRTILSIADAIVYIPQFIIPESGPLREDLFPDNQGFSFFFYFSVSIAFFFPFYTLRAIRKARDGTLGCGPDGKPATLLSREGMYMQGLGFIQNNLYFGVLRTLTSAFSCVYSVEDAAFYLKDEASVECFTLKGNMKHVQYILLGTLAILLFFPLATMLVPTIQFYNKALDLKFDQGYVIAERQADLFVAIFSVFFSSTPEIILYGQLFICTSLAILNYKMNPCLVPSMNFLKTGLYSLCAYFTLCGLVYIYMSKSGNVTAGIFFFTMVMMVIGWPVFALSGWMYYNREKVLQKIKEFRRNKKDLGDEIVLESNESRKTVLPADILENENRDEVKSSELQTSEHTVLKIPDDSKQAKKVNAIIRKAGNIRRRSSKVKPTL